MLSLKQSVTPFRVKRFAAAARGLACFLAGAVLVFELLAANGAFHNAFHHDGKAASNPCVLCLLANGLVDSPESAPIVTAFVPSPFHAAPQITSIVKTDVSYLTSSSRAPPLTPSLLLSVLA